MLFVIEDPEFLVLTGEVWDIELFELPKDIPIARRSVVSGATPFGWSVILEVWSRNI
jgi:hypothetical protein